MGSADYAQDAGVILKTIDRGETWTTPSKQLFPNCSNGDQGWTNRLVVDPANKDVVYFAARNGLWRTSDGGVNWQPVAGAPPGDQKKLRTGGGGPSGTV